MPRTRRYRRPTNAHEYLEELSRIRQSPGFGFERAVSEHRQLLSHINREGDLDKWGPELGRLTDDVAADFAHQKDVNSPTRYADQIAKRRKKLRMGNDDPTLRQPDFGLGEMPDPVFFPTASPTGVDLVDDFIRLEAKRLVDARDEQRAFIKARRKMMEQIESRFQRAEQFFAKADSMTVPDIATPPVAAVSDEMLPIALPELSSASPVMPCGTMGPVTPPPLKTKPKGSRPKRVRWEGTPDQTKAVMMARAIHEGGHGLAITVNLTHEMVKAAEGRNKTLAQQLQDRISKLLKRRCGTRPDFFFVLERSFREQPHFHGVIDLPNDPATLKQVRSALMALGGTKLEVNAMRRKVNIQSLYNPARWGSYPFKRQATARMVLGTRQLLSATNNLRKRGEAIFKAATSANRTSGS